MVAPNQVRRQWRDKFRSPNTVYTACPSMDKVVKSRLSATTKSHNKQLARQQALLLDAVGPITHILEEAAQVPAHPDSQTCQVSRIRGSSHAHPQAIVNLTQTLKLPSLYLLRDIANPSRNRAELQPSAWVRTGTDAAGRGRD